MWRRLPDTVADGEVDGILMAAGARPGAPLVGLHLGAAFGGSKLWPAASFAALADRLVAGGLTPLLLGTADDAPVAARVRASARAAIPSAVARDRVPLLPRLLARLRCLVSGDTGIAHLTAAVGVPTITLFGPTDPRLTAPRGSAARLLQGDAPCAPCFLRSCPIDHICLRGIAVETVEQEVHRALAPGSPPPSPLRSPWPPGRGPS